GNPVAAIALMRLYGYTNEKSYREKAEQTLEVLAGVAGQYGIFAATYGIAAVYFSRPHTQVIVVGDDDLADRLSTSARARFAFNTSTLNLATNKAVSQNLPPALAETIPQLPLTKEQETAAIICSGFACQPPISDPETLAQALLRRQAG